MCGHAAGAGDEARAAGAAGGGSPPAPAAGGTTSPAARAGWIVAGFALAALVLVTLFLTRDGSAPGAAAAPPTAAAAAAGPSDIDLSSMPPREAADRLFNRVMESVSRGDSAQARAFAPMAIAAYDRVQPLDLDGHYHVAVLHLVDDDPEASLGVADRILVEAPTHLFALYTAAQAREMMGDAAAATLLYQDFLDNYDAEIELDRTEYRDHSPLLPMMREDARSKTS